MWDSNPRELSPVLTVFIPEGAGPCQRGFCPDSGWVRACVTSVCRFLIAADVRGGRVAGSGTGRSPAARWAAPQASLRRLAASPMIGRRETGAGSVRGIRLCVQVRPVVRVWRAAVPLAAFIPSHAPAGPGVHGAVRVRAGGQAGSIKTPPAPPGGGGAENRATSRLAAGQESCSCRVCRRRSPAARPQGPGPGSGSARRASRSRPGSAAAARRRPSRCCGPGARAGR